MKKCILLTIFLSSLGLCLHSQSLRDRIFHTVGSTSFLDYYATPIASVAYLDKSTGENYTVYNRFSGFSVTTIIYRIRMNIHEISDEMAIYASLSPAVGLSFATDTRFSDDIGLGCFNIPLMIGLDFGTGSTYSSRSEYGGFLGLGIDYNYFPLFSSEPYVFVARYNGKPKTSWVHPAITGGFRFWSQKNRLREIAFKVGMGNKQVFYRSTQDDPEDKRSITARLEFNYVLNY